jgi:hypothetical protein
MKGIFQKTILAVGGLYLLYMALPFFWLELYDQETLEVLSWQGYGGLLDIYGPIPYILACALLVSLVGLYQLKKWGRTTFMLVTIITGVISPLWGLQTMGQLDSLPAYFVSIGSGAILAMAYLSSIGGEFE